MLAMVANISYEKPGRFVCHNRQENGTLVSGNSRLVANSEKEGSFLQCHRRYYAEEKPGPLSEDRTWCKARPQATANGAKLLIQTRVLLCEPTERGRDMYKVAQPKNDVAWYTVRHYRKGGNGRRLARGPSVVRRMYMIP